MRLRMLDAMCGQGGAGAGYRAAGFEVVGVDIEPQPKYPFEFVQADAVEFIREHGHEFVAIHASPPCRFYSGTQRIMGNDHPDLIWPTRKAILETGKPYVIENVGGAAEELIHPVMLCGAMFGMQQYRHRYFETNWPLDVPPDPPHVARQAKMGRAPKPGEFIQMVGNFSGVAMARQDTGMWWANRDGLRECIPPQYSEFIGRRLLEHLEREAKGDLWQQEDVA